MSPHLDDAVLSVGQVLAGSPGAVVVTVFAGIPAGDALAAYDRNCGFTSSRQAMRHRRVEDERALATLGARPLHLDFLAGEHGGGGDEEALVRDLAAAISSVGPSAVLGPVGIFHPDHERLARLWPGAARRAGGVPAYAYEELPYRVKAPRRAGTAARAFAAAHAAREAALPTGDAGRKAIAMLAYVTQLRWVFPPECLAPERLWRLWAAEPEGV